MDICPVCKGIWFDAGELAGVVKRLSSGEDIVPQETKLFHEREIHTTYQVKEKEKSCPKCNSRMHRFNYSYDSNVFIDKCPDCGGIWTDGGEALQIASYLKDDPKTIAIGKAIAEEFAKPMEEPDTTSWLGWFVFLPRITIPIGDDTEREKFPAATISIIALCALVFYRQCTVVDADRFVRTFGFVPANFFSLGLITSMFLHTDIIHLAGNMLFLWLFGDNIEDRFSRFTFVLVYIFCGVFAAFLQGVFSLNSQVPLVGASGAVAGIMGAYLIFYPTAKLEFLIMYRIVEIPALLYLGGWFIFQLIAAFSANEGQVSSNIAWYAHIGGFLCGAVIAFLKKITTKEPNYQQAHPA